MGFEYYSPITVQSGQVPSAQTDFPMLVSYTDDRLKTLSNGGHVRHANGYDIRPFSDASLNTALTFELEYYNGSTGQVVMWVKIPSLSNGYVIYLGYGNSSLTSDGSSTSTWNTNFKAVYHLGDGATLSMADSTSNGNTATNNGATAVTGKLRGGAAFDGLTQNIDIPDQALGSVHTISLWLNYKSGGNDVVMGGIAGVYCPGFDGGGAGQHIYYSVNEFVGIVHGGLTSGTFYKINITRNDATIKFYKNGSQIGTTQTLGQFRLDLTLKKLGMYDDGTGSCNCEIDEVRFADIDRDADWITTEYNNESNPSAFAVLGAEQSILVLDQEGFRFRNDDGSESAATWLAAQDTNVSRDKNLNTRLRMIVNATSDPPSKQYQLEYRRNAGPWKKVDNT